MGKVIHAEARFAARRIKADRQRRAPSGDGNSPESTPKNDARTRRLQRLVDKEKR